MTPTHLKRFFEVANLKLGEEIRFESKLKAWQNGEILPSYNKKTPKNQLKDSPQKTVEQSKILPNTLDCEDDFSPPGTSYSSTIHTKAETPLHFEIEDLDYDNSTDQSYTVSYQDEQSQLHAPSSESLIQQQNTSTQNQPQATSSTIVRYVKDSLSSESTKIFDGNGFNLEKLLIESSQGRAILNLYQNENELNDGCRGVLLDLIINYLFENEIKMTVTLSKIIAEKIVEVFPTEVLVCVYLITVLDFLKY